MQKLMIFENRGQEWTLLESYVRQRFAQGKLLRILEAGCGRRWLLDLTGVDYALTGIDTDESALAIRTQQVCDLDEAIVGDLRHTHLHPDSYDVIFNSFVLEHIKGAEQVLARFFQWLKPGGGLLRHIPDRNSVFGLTTRMTPFGFHIIFKRLVGLLSLGRLACADNTRTYVIQKQLFTQPRPCHANVILTQSTLPRTP